MDSSDPPWTLQTREVVYAGEALEVIHDHVDLPSGERLPFEYASESPSVVILPFTTAGEVVTITEWRQAVNRFSTGLPAGTVEESDADFREAARRELREETGFDSSRIEPLTVFEPANGPTDFEHHYFVAQACERVAEPNHEKDETITVSLKSFSSLLSAVETGDLRDGRSALGILWYAATHTPP